MTHTTLETWLILRAAGPAAVLIFAGFMRLRPHLPHHHDGYVSMNGYVHACSLCGKLPPGTTRTGFNETLVSDEFRRWVP